MASCWYFYGYWTNVITNVLFLLIFKLRKINQTKQFPVKSDNAITVVNLLLNSFYIIKYRLMELENNLSIT